MSTQSSFARRYGAWALVTGASDGIGQAFAQELAARGLNLILVARRVGLLEAQAEMLRRSYRVQCRVFAADLSQPRAVHELHHSLADIDLGLLIAAAGYGTSGLLVNADLAVEGNMVSLNCAALMMSTWYCARRFSAQGRGGIVLLSSLVGFHGTPGTANYAATKAYVQTLAEGLRAELKSLGVDVIACAPGPVRSGFAERAGMKMGQAENPEVVASLTLDALGKRTTVRPGWLSKLLGWSLASLPRWGQIWVIGKVMKGMTAGHPDSKKPGVA